MRVAIVAVITLLLASCAGTSGLQQNTREVAKQVVRPIVAQQFPGVPTDLVVDCTIDNATGAEVISLAQSALTADSAGATNTVTQIIARPATVQCIATRASQGLLAGDFSQFLQ